VRSLSIRARLTVWYVVVLAGAMTLLAAGSWWLFRKSVLTEADSSLTARIEGVRQFIGSMDPRMERAELDDELKEYGQLTAGQALLEIVDASGKALYRPASPGWDDIRIVPASGGVTLANRYSSRRPFRVAAALVAPHGQPYAVITAVDMAPSYAAWIRFGWLLALLLPVVGALAAAGGYWISRRALTPVDRLTLAARAITLRNLDRRVDVPDPDDEIKRLAITLNDMLAGLQSSVADMVRFTADASHELRTPVSVVRATSEIALSRPRSAAEYREALTEILEQAERMSALVDDLLTLARADAGVEARETAPAHLGEIVQAAVRQLRAAAEQRGLIVDVHVVADGRVEAVAESLRRLFVILLDNAIKYTPAGGAVNVTVDTGRAGGGANHAMVEIRDTGPGINTADLPFVFDRFYRGAAARAAAEGSGLGLSIARTIVERHRGSIEIAAVADTGCAITVRLPTVAASTQVETAFP
jgi:heavy metal sensor kinase